METATHLIQRKQNSLILKMGASACGCIMVALETNLRELSDKLTNRPKYIRGYIDLQELDNSLVHTLFILVKSIAHSPWCVVHQCQLPKASLVVVVEYLREGWDRNTSIGPRNPLILEDSSHL